MHRTITAACGLAAITLPALAQPGFTYLALGDSLAYGYQSLMTSARTNGDMGYVAGVADGLAAMNGGLRPTVLNLGVPGDTSANFFAGGEIGAVLNTNYPFAVPVTTSQNALFQSALANNAGLPGGPIGFVTLQLGVNDLIDLATQDGFLAMPLEAQVAAARAEFGAIAANIAGILADLSGAVPDADVRVIGYYDPFAVFLTSPGLDPFASTDGRGSALAQLSRVILPELNDLLEQLAVSYDATYVETADLFVGRETELTLITTVDLSLPNIHPNDLGYALLAERILAVPTPAGVALLAFSGVIAIRRRR